MSSAEYALSALSFFKDKNRKGVMLIVITPFLFLSYMPDSYLWPPAGVAVLCGFTLESGD
jgi:hypothetical protein